MSLHSWIASNSAFIDTVQFYKLRYFYAPYVVHAILMVFCYFSHFKTIIHTQLLKHAVYMSGFILVITLCLVVHLCSKTAFQTMGISKYFGCCIILQYCINQMFESKHI